MKSGCPDGIYCKNCKYYKAYLDNEGGLIEECEAVIERFHDYKDCYERYGDPKIINRNNDCRLFEEKKSIFYRIKTFFVKFFK